MDCIEKCDNCKRARTLQNETLVCDVGNKNKVLYLDFERTFEKRFATSVGVDTSPDKFFQLTFDTIEDMSDGIEDLVKSGEVAAIILDSDAAAPTRTTITDPAGKACVSPETEVEFELL